MAAPAPIVEMQGISVEFPGVKALDDVDFRLFPGEVHTLMGENGAGKSTLIKALTGVYGIDAGTIRIDGEERHLHGEADAQAAGISTVYQEINLVTNLSIGENVMLGHEIRGPLGVNWKATHAAATTHLAKLGLEHLDPRQPLSTLSLAMQQLVAISRAMVTESKVLILDEPTSSLDAAEVERLFGVIRGLRKDGVAILFVSHFIDQVYEIGDRMTVLRNGKYEGEYMTMKLDRTDLISKMIGKDVATLKKLGAKAKARKVDEKATPILRAVELGRKGSIEPTDLELHRGQVVGFAGLLGSGRTEYARLLYGADRPDHGVILVNGKSVNIHSPAAALKHNITFSSENRRDEGVVVDLTVRENIILAVQANRGWARPLSKKETKRIVDKYMKELNVVPPDPDRVARTLSGGNQQKVLLCRWLATDPEALILDEPTRGIDVGAKAEIEATVAALADEGVGVIFISSEIEEVVRLSDTILVLRDRHKVAEIENSDKVTAQTVVAAIAEEGNGK